MSFLIVHQGLRFLTPAGVKAISRWLSAATPPVTIAHKSTRPRQGSQTDRDNPFRRLFSWPPPISVCIIIWSSAQKTANLSSTPSGVPGCTNIWAVRLPVSVDFRRKTFLRPLPGGRVVLFVAFTGGIAALNHRLMALTPTGVKKLIPHSSPPSSNPPSPGPQRAAGPF
jgi:hypothetical protein